MIDDEKKAKSYLQEGLKGIKFEYEILFFHSVSTYGESYAIRMKEKEEAHNEQSISEDQKIENQLYILKIIDKNKFLKKERTAVMKMIIALTHVEHLNICSNQFFFMSNDFFYYIYKMKQVYQKESSNNLISTGELENPRRNSSRMIRGLSIISTQKQKEKIV